MCHRSPSQGSTKQPSFQHRLTCSSFQRRLESSSCSFPNIASSDDVGVQIPPLRIRRFDQIELPVAPPYFYRFLTRDGSPHRIVLFEPHECVYTISFRETFHRVGLVFPDALFEMRSDADVKRPKWLAGQNIHAWILRLSPSLGFPGPELTISELDSGLPLRGLQNDG